MLKLYTNKLFLMEYKPVRMKQFNIRRLVTIVPAGILMLVIALTIGITSVSAYDCGTYSAGTYNEGDYGTGESCPTDSGTPTNPTTPTTPTTSQPSGTGSTGTTTSNGSPNTTTPPLTQNPVEGSQSITLNDYAAYLNGDGQEVTMKVGDKVYFTVGSESHSATVKEITATYVVVTVASTPVDVTIPLGKTINYDVNKDGTEDLKMSYKNISADGLSATVIFTSLAVADNAAPVVTENESVEQKQSYLWLIIIGVIILVIVVALIVRKRVTSKTPNA